MKEKRSKKESNKEEAKEEGTEVLEFAAPKKASLRDDLKIDWPSFIRFFNDTPKPDASRKRFAKNSANGARKGHAEPSATKNTSE